MVPGVFAVGALGVGTPGVGNDLAMFGNVEPPVAGLGGVAGAVVFREGLGAALWVAGAAGAGFRRGGVGSAVPAAGTGVRGIDGRGAVAGGMGMTADSAAGCGGIFGVAAIGATAQMMVTFSASITVVVLPIRICVTRTPLTDNPFALPRSSSSQPSAVGVSRA